MKITAEELDKIIRLTGAEDSSGLRMALAYRLVSIWDQGYNEGFSDAKEAAKQEEENSILPYADCPYTHAHTREWCGYAKCRES